MIESARGSLLIVEDGEKSNFADFVTSIISHYAEKDPNSIHDVGILHYQKSKTKVDEIVSEILQKICARNLNAVFLPLKSMKLFNQKPRKISFIVIIADQNIIKNILIIARFWKNNTKIIFVMVDCPPNVKQLVSTFLMRLRYLSFLAVEDVEGEIKAYSHNPFNPMEQQFYEVETGNFEDLFPNKLHNLKGYVYNIFVNDDMPRLYVNNGFIIGLDFDTLSAIAEQQNSSINVKSRSEEGKIFSQHPSSQELDLVLNSFQAIHNLEAFYEQVNTFETDGYCALVPFPTRESLFDFVLKPFDFFTWILILFSIISFGIAWYCINKIYGTTTVSTGYFLFSFIAHFFGQSISIRQHSNKQKFLMQLTILLTFILGNVYQSLIISFITDPQIGDKIKTIDEMAKRNFSYITTPLIKLSMIDISEEYAAIKTRIISTEAIPTNFKELSENNVALILECSFADHILYKLSSSLHYDEKPINFYYKVTEKLYSFHLFFLMS